MEFSILFWPPPSGGVKYGIYLWFFLNILGKICVVFWRISQHLWWGKRGIMVFKIIWLFKNGMECDRIKGLIWRQNTKKTLKFYWKLSLYYQKKDKKKVWNGVDPPRPVMENSILFIFFIFETFPYEIFPFLLHIEFLSGIYSGFW